jgi:hypothetical protein
MNLPWYHFAVVVFLAPGLALALALLWSGRKRIIRNWRLGREWRRLERAQRERDRVLRNRIRRLDRADRQARSGLFERN